MGNIHFLEILDFIVGWTGLDISGDDEATYLAKLERAKKSRLAAAKTAAPAVASAPSSMHGSVHTSAATPAPSAEVAARPSTHPAPAKDPPWWTRPKPGPPSASVGSKPTLRRDPQRIDIGPLDAQP